MTSPQTNQWDPNRYDTQHAFVHKLGAGVIELLDPKPGERILDVGCGTGHLTNQIAERGAETFGVDASAEMIAEARKNFPSLTFEVMDATAMRFDHTFDAIFSNAALHWIRPPEAAAARMSAALRAGGRIAVEFGGQGNVAKTLGAASAAAKEIGLDLDHLILNHYYPTIAAYATLLEQNGLQATTAFLFDRPTELSDGEAGLRNWYRMFRSEMIAAIPGNRLDEFFEIAEKITRPILWRDGKWFADYRRIRVVAVKS